MKIVVIFITIIFIFSMVACNKGSKKETLSKDVSSDVQVEMSESRQMLSKGKMSLQEKDYNSARVYYEKAISLDKGNKELYLQVKNDYLREARYDDAYEIINIAIDNNVDVDNMQEILEEIKVHFDIIEIIEEIEEGSEYYPPDSTVVLVNGEERRVDITWNKYIPNQLSVGDYIYDGYSDKYGRTIKLNIVVKEREVEVSPIEEPISNTDTDTEPIINNEEPVINKEEPSIDTVTEPVEEIKENPEDENNEILNPEKLVYTIGKCYLNDENISIGFPEVREMKDENLQRVINENIFKKVEEIAAYYKVENPKMKIDYTIKLANNILSVVYSGQGNYEGAAYPMNFFYTRNIDMTTGNILTLSDLVTIDGDFIGKLKATPTLNDGSIENYFSNLSDEDILNKLNNSDTTNAEVQSYLTEEGYVGVSIAVPHVLGDHLEYEVLQ